MDKNELVKELKDARRTEESAVQVYMKHLKAIVKRSTLEDDQVDKIRNVIKKLIQENKRHYEIVNSLITKVEEGRYDDNE